MRQVEGRTAFVTGGGSGIGLAMAKAFLDAGMRVVAADVRQDHLDRAAAELAGRAVHFIRLDVADRDAMAAAADEAERVFGKVHLLCNNAGVACAAPMDQAGYEDWDWVLGVNLGGTINGLVTFLPRMKAHGEGGHVVNTASGIGLVPGGGRGGVYSTSKFAIFGLTASLRFNLAPYRIGVSVLCPGLTHTNMGEAEQTRPARLASKAPPQPPRTSLSPSEAGMEPAEVAEKVLTAVRSNEPYIMTTLVGFKAEVREFFDEILAALPTSEKGWDRQDEYEEQRRRGIAEAKAKVTAIKDL